MNTPFIILAQYQTAIIPLNLVCRDYFQHLTPETFARKSLSGEIAIPVVQIEGSQKATKGVHVADLANWIDTRRAAAMKELTQINT
ncbi:MAG: pyocin activator PrtN family protein [Rhodobacteraceae bacterium]|nr:pyocin activator PrtN family protein [Paracoccaceae bacterium]